MRLLRKIDNYLLENHPLLWMSKIHYVIPASILVNAIFWLWGNFTVNAITLRNYIGERIFFDSYAIYGYLLATLMFIILWATSYFKKNASRHLYPLKKFYFTKLLLLLFIIFYLIGAPFLSFYAGVNAKVQSLANYEELQEDIKMVNLAQAFLPTHSGNSYKYSNYYEAKNPGYVILDQNSWGSYDYLDGTYNPYENEQNNDTTYDGYPVQCLKIKEMPVDCKHNYGETVYVGFRKVPEQALSNEDNVNYRTEEFIDEESFNTEPHGWFDYYWYYDEERSSDLDYNKSIRSISESRHKIQETLEEFDAFLTKHEIKHAFNAPVIASYLAKNNGAFDYGFIDENMSVNDYYYYNPEHYEEGLKKKEEQYKKSSAKATLADLESGGMHYGLFLIDNHSLQLMFDNSKRTYYWQSFYIESITIGFVALGLAFLFLMFSFADFITLVITIPSIGVLVIINALICGIIYSVVRSDNYLFIEPVVFAIGIVVTYLLLLKKKNVSRRLVHGFGYISGFISTMLLIGIAGTIAVLSRERVLECNYWSYEYSELMRWVEDPGFVFILALTGIVFYTFTIKKLLAKPD